MTDIDSATPEPPVLRLGEPEDLLSAIPYLLKYHPSDSLVFLLLRGHRLIVTARLGINFLEEADGSAIAAYLQRVCAEHDADGLVLVGYFRDPACASVLLVDVMMELESVAVQSALVADGTHWWPCICEHEEWEDCDCEAGTPYDVSTSAVAAQAVLAGISALPSREALASSVAGPQSRQARDTAAALMEEALRALSELDLGERRDRMALLVERHLLDREPLSDRDCAELAVLAYEGPVRDIAVGRIRPDDAAAHVTLWHRVVSQTVAPFESAPLCLLGLAAWISGNGALQVVCMERAERINPDYSLLQILDQINARALAPSVWEQLRAA
ncbi:DUF4192 domain-containing protein [Granulicoccus sp. GXG6511]|uniref:DUF4192 domain-containing protein n=1 Tax=Granulicoccus sp. GXG6511 TaxID=3381351 RepID=UPI003D7DD23F